MSNLKGKYTEGDGEAQPLKIQVNSLDKIVSVDRLAIISSTATGIYLYGRDNNYPRKIIQSAERSSSLETSRKAFAKFLMGLGFEGATADDVKNGTSIEINREGDTLYDLLKFCADEKSKIDIAIHVNYNALGEAVEFTPVQYPFVRRKIKRQDEKFERYIISDIWHTEDYTNSSFAGHKIQEFNSWMADKKQNLSFCALECFAFNDDPIIVREQIELCGGIENYSGQLFYANNSRNVYPKAKFDSVADKFQFLAESDLASLSNIQNGYSVSGILKYPSSIADSQELDDMKNNVRNNTTGASNTGRLLMMPINTQGDIPSNVFEPTQMQNIDNLYKHQIEVADNGIRQSYLQPNSIIGKDTEGNFATQDMQAAYDKYNADTQPDRQELEIQLTRLFKNSIYKDKIKLPITIEKLRYEGTVIESNETNIKDNETTDK